MYTKKAVSPTRRPVLVRTEKRSYERDRKDRSFRRMVRSVRRVGVGELGSLSIVQKLAMTLVVLMGGNKRRGCDFLRRDG